MGIKEVQDELMPFARILQLADCPECGKIDRVDEDGCCLMCGSDAMVYQTELFVPLTPDEIRRHIGRLEPSVHKKFEGMLRRHETLERVRGERNREIQRLERERDQACAELAAVREELSEMTEARDALLVRIEERAPIAGRAGTAQGLREDLDRVFAYHGAIPFDDAVRVLQNVVAGYGGARRAAVCLSCQIDHRHPAAECGKLGCLTCKGHGAAEASAQGSCASCRRPLPA